jgi:hypothetical protein
MWQRAALLESMQRVIDLFHSWDRDGSGSIDRHEFHGALVAAGIHAPLAEVNALFDEFGAHSGRPDRETGADGGVVVANGSHAALLDVARRRPSGSHSAKSMCRVVCAAVHRHGQIGQHCV